MGAYEWNGSWAKWELREIEYLLKCVKDCTRTEDEVWVRFLEIMRREKHR